MLTELRPLDDDDDPRRIRWRRSWPLRPRG
jgi:hypothetical protein